MIEGFHGASFALGLAIGGGMGFVLAIGWGLMGAASTADDQSERARRRLRLVRDEEAEIVELAEWAEHNGRPFPRQSRPTG